MKYKPTENETSTHILLEINSQKNAFISKLNCHRVYKKREPKQWWACSWVNTQRKLDIKPNGVHSILLSQNIDTFSTRFENELQLSVCLVV